MAFTGASILILIAGMIAGYLLGSVNFAIIITRLCGKGDIRKYGSGNAGMTNVLRTVGKGAAALTLLGDFCKGILSVLFVRLLLMLFVGGDHIVCDYLVAFSALLGHVFPLYYGFKGGKGILVSAGCLLILSPWSLLLCLIVFLILAASTRYISLGSLGAAVMAPLGNLLVSYLKYGRISWLEVVLMLPISLLIIYLHHQNISRLIQDLFRNHMDPDFHPDVDWRDVILRDYTWNQQYFLSASGGGEVARYYICLLYTSFVIILDIELIIERNGNCH